MSVYVVTVVSQRVTLCPNLEFWYFRGSFRRSCNIVKDNPKERSFRTKASVFLTMTWKLLNLSYLFSWSERLIWTHWDAVGWSQSILTLGARLLNTLKNTSYFISLFKRTNESDDCGQKILISHSPGFHIWTQRISIMQFVLLSRDFPFFWLIGPWNTFKALIPEKETFNSFRGFFFCDMS